MTNITNNAQLINSIDTLILALRTFGSDIVAKNSDGIHEAKTKSPIEEKLDTLVEMVKNLPEMFADMVVGVMGSKESLTGLGNSAKEIAGDFDVDAPISKKEAKSEKEEKGGLINPTPNDLLNIDLKYSIGALLIYNKLDEISKKLGKEGGSDKKVKGGGLGSFLSNLGGGMATLAMLGISLVGFVVAIKVFSLSLEDIGTAILGIGLFAGFIVGAVFLAKLVGKEEKTFKNFAQGCLLLVAGLLAFSLTLIVLKFVIDFLGPEGLAKAQSLIEGFGFFVLAFVVLAKIVSAGKGSFLQFSLGVLLLVASLALFGVALVVLKYCATLLTVDDIIPIGIILVAFIGIVAIFTGLGVAMGLAIPFLILLGAGAIALSLGLVALTGALLLISKVRDHINIPAIQEVIPIFDFVLSEFARIGAESIFAIIGLTLLTATSVALALTVGLLTGAVFLLSKISISMLKHAEEVFKGENGSIKAFIKSIASVKFTGKEKSNLKSLKSISNTTKDILLDVTEVIKELNKIPLKNLQGITQVVGELINQTVVPMITVLTESARGLSLKNAIAMPIIAMSVKPIIETMDKLVGIVLNMNCVKGDSIVQNGRATKISDITKAITGIFENVLIPIIDKLEEQANKMGVIATAKMWIISKSISPVIDCVQSLVNIVTGLGGMGKGVSPEKMKNSLQGIIGSISSIASELETIPKLNSRKLKSLDKDLNSITSITEKIQKIMSTESGSGNILGGFSSFIKDVNNISSDGVSTFVGLLESIRSIKIKDSLAPLLELVSKDTIRRFDNLANSLNKVADAMERVAKGNKESMTTLKSLDGGVALQKGKMGKGSSSSASNIEPADQKEALLQMIATNMEKLVQLLGKDSDLPIMDYK